MRHDQRSGAHVLREGVLEPVPLHWQSGSRRGQDRLGATAYLKEQARVALLGEELDHLHGNERLRQGVELRGADRREDRSVWHCAAQRLSGHPVKLLPSL
eukprot:scaffold27758_cov112-Isochrysis_galbana.AAC.4